MVYEISGFRINKYNKGYLIEIEKSKWTLFGIKKYWVHYISHEEICDEALYFTNFEMALRKMINGITYEVSSQ